MADTAAASRRLAQDAERLATGPTAPKTLRSLAALAAPLLLIGAGEAPRKPNIVIILADDLGYADVGAQGGTEMATPHIDSLARDGVRFTNGYVSGPVCAPARAGLRRWRARFCRSCVISRR